MSQRSTAPASAARTTTPGVDIGRTWTQTPHAEHAAGVPRARARRARQRRRRAGQRREVGTRRDRARRASARASAAARGIRRTGSGDRAAHGSAPAQRGRRAPRQLDGGGRSRPRTRAACCTHGSRAVGARPPRRGRADRVHAGRGLQPRRPLPPRLPRARAQAARRDRAARSRRRAASATSASAAMGLFESCTAAIPYAPATRVPGQRAGQARPTRTRGRRDATRARSSPTASARTHGVTRAVEEIRARGVRGLRDRGARHRPRSRPPAVRRRRVRGALLPGPADRRAEPARPPCRRSPTAAST